MSDEPMSDAELAAIQARGKDHALSYEFGRDVPDALHDYVADVPRLLAEVERLRAENAALREIVDAVIADNGPLVQDREYGAYDCGYCEGVPEQWRHGTYAMTRDAFIHAPDCLVTRARAQLGEEANHG